MPDVNVLVYAHREDEEVHAPYAEWLDRLVNGPEPFALSVLVAAGFVRVVTNQRIYTDPTPLTIALGLIEQLTSHDGCRIVTPGPSHLGLFDRLCRSIDARGSSVADAQHAAIAIAEGCTWVTRDRDFAHFEPAGLRWEHLAP